MLQTKIFSRLARFFCYAKDCVLRVTKDPLFLSHWEKSSAWDIKDRNQITVQVIGGTFRKKEYDYKGSVFMFCQDMHDSIMPFLHITGGGGDSFSATLEPTNPDLEKIVAEGLRGRGHQYRLADAVCEFVRDAAQTLFFFGCVSYEIVCQKDDKGGLKGFSLVRVHPLSVKKILGNYYQFIPWSVARESKVKVGLTKIPKENIIYIGLPKELGGTNGLRRILRRLFRLSQELLPAFHMQALQDNKNVGLNLDKYTHEKYIEQALLTKDFGWNQRKVPDNNILEYYSLYRRLKKTMAQIIVREKVIESINQALSGPLLNLGVRIQVEGLQTKSQIEGLYEKLCAGNVEFVDIFTKTQS